MINSMKTVGRFLVDVAIAVAILLIFIVGLVIGLVSGCGIGQGAAMSKERSHPMYFSRAYH